MSFKTLYFDNFCGYSMSAIVENDKLIEFSFEEDSAGTIVGNIYKGRVESVLPGMQAAFVNCGLERNCYLSADEASFDKSKYDGGDAERPLAFNVKEGDEVIVQVVKAPIGKKGAKVTLGLSFVGKGLIYLPDTPFVGVSRKIADEELRKNLIYTATKLISEGDGVIIRTAAPHAKRGQLELELTYLKNLYKKVKASFKTAGVGDLLYSDVALPIRVMRDTLSNDVEQIMVGSKEVESLLSEFVALYPPRGRKQILIHDGKRDMFEETGLADQISEIISPRVELENGAYLVIEKTEALTVIDVNTGKFVGDDSLEQTVYYTNILAAREIARQVRLRNIGGIVIVDFIDMQTAAHKNALVEELERALKNDKAKCLVSPMSRLGLVEFTRKRTGAATDELMIKPCKQCRQVGYTKSFLYILYGVRAKILALIAEGNNTLCLDMNFDVAQKLINSQAIIDDLKSRAPQARIYIISHRTWGEEKVTYRCESGGSFALPEGTVLLY